MCIRDRHSGKIIMTPLSPLNVSYQLEVLNKLSNEEVDYHIDVYKRQIEEHLQD